MDDSHVFIITWQHGEGAFEEWWRTVSAPSVCRRCYNPKWIEG